METVVYALVVAVSLKSGSVVTLPVGNYFDNYEQCTSQIIRSERILYQSDPKVILAKGKCVPVQPEISEEDFK